MTVALCIVIALAAYLAVGRIIANRLAPTLARRVRAEWGRDDELVRSSFREVYGWTVVVWPVRLLYEVLRGGTDEMFDRVDPRAIAARERQQADRIASLERQLGVSR